MSELMVVTNARIVTPERVILGTVEVLKGAIVAVYRGTTAWRGAIDLDGDYLIPGLVELHTDNLEQTAQPRPGVKWPAMAAVIAHDAQVVAAGITTVFDALAVGDISFHKTTPRRPARDLVGAIHGAVEQGLTRSRHHLHIRCEVGSEDLITELEPMIDDPLVKLVSVMDHAPGQRQYADLTSYKLWYETRYKMGEEELSALMKRQIEASRTNGERQRKAVVDMCRKRRLPLASHDDATPEHVEQAVGEGGVIAEFPTTEEAARAAHARGLRVLMGAPNVVQGGSHSGNVSALDLANRGLLDILSSDYIPSSLIQAAFALHFGTVRMSLPEAVATVSLTPARAAGLTDRGEIAPGKRADIVRVRCPDSLPVVDQVWRGGDRVF